jgi:predicted NBD/HSP70 family sugar kinase
MTEKEKDGAPETGPIDGQRDAARGTVDITQYFRKDSKESYASIKDINYVKILDLIHSVRSISRTTIATRLNLSKTTVTSVVNRLMSDNIVLETGKGDATKGRKPRMLEFNREVKVSIGLELGDTECIGILTDMYAHPIDTPVTIPIAREAARDGWLGKSAVVETIQRLTENCEPGSVLGVGIGIPGIYDLRHHSIRVAESLGLENMSTRKLEDSLGFPVKVLNRANAAALGEKWYHADAKCQNLLYVSIGDGVGAGIIQNGQLLTGATGSAGEIGHMTIMPYGPLCRCGSNGCLESLVSRNILIARAKDLIQKNRHSILRKIVSERFEAITLETILEAARAGDADILKLLQQQAEYIGMAIVNAISMVDPQLVIIGGETGMLLGEIFLPTITKTVAERARYFKEVEVIISSLGRLASCVGASAYVLST